MKITAVAIAILAVSASTFADSLRATATRMGKLASAALAHKDFKAFDIAVRPCVTPGFRFTEMGHSMNFDRMVAEIKAGLSSLPNVSSSTSKILSCAEHGKTGTTTTTHRIVATMVGPDKKHHKLVSIGKSTDSWVKVGGVWKMSVMAWGAQTMTVDGKRMNPNQAPRRTPVTPKAK
ncbi:MAG: hypothetical protein ACYC96_03385 [Fimbriimonadaceae bacterium]